MNPSIYPSIYPSTYPSIYLSIYLSICIFAYICFAESESGCKVAIRSRCVTGRSGSDGLEPPEIRRWSQVISGVRRRTVKV